MNRGPLIVVLVAAAASAACGPPPIDSEATRAVFLETCAPGSRAVEVAVCECAYDRLAKELDDGELARLDRRLREDPDDRPSLLLDVTLECAGDLLEPSLPPTTQPR